MFTSVWSSDPKISRSSQTTSLLTRYLAEPHHLLEQVPLTVSPFVSLPTAATLSYNYKTMPSSIPPSSLGIQAASDDPNAQAYKPKFVVSGSGEHAAHPDDILASCRALHEHITKLQQDAERELREFEEKIRQQQLAEKRRVAPGWLDSDARILQPQRTGADQVPDLMSDDTAGINDKGKEPDIPVDDQGAELDKAFGGMDLKS